MIDIDVFRDELTRILPKSQHKKIEPIVALLLDDSLIYEIEVCRTRAGIEHVDAYGLLITLDANGEAAAIEFPYGAEMIA
ncbi:hypothetical protein Aca07nite_27890 [Actinoplanes capillaceus]|uniref:Uncharacterized protein n=1 Tax=Actinoplanes campanulatus TaxID=113559 RepID=A0ABQ3WGZ6_9ACTN|nr:hypothetical protein [Actinoplanes capillaceus]GID45514.1 hypothetical protein Aca07nite_27890 [Actinoplanes capillaceus]